MRNFLIFTLLFSVTSSVMAGLVKWVDAEGKVHYSDSAPPNVKVQPIKNRVSQQAPAISDTDEKPATASSVTAKTPAEKELERKKEQQAREKEEEKAAKLKEAAEAKQKNCANARSNLTNMQNSPLIVTYNEKGERSFMDDAGRNSQIEEAKKAVDSYCN